MAFSTTLESKQLRISPIVTTSSEVLGFDKKEALLCTAGKRRNVESNMTFEQACHVAGVPWPVFVAQLVWMDGGMTWHFDKVCVGCVWEACFVYILLMSCRPLSVPFACWHGIYNVYMYNIYTLYGCKLQVPRASLMVWSPLPREIGRRNTTGTCTSTSLWTGPTKRTFLQEKNLGCEEQKCQRVNSYRHMFVLICIISPVWNFRHRIVRYYYTRML